MINLKELIRDLSMESIEGNTDIKINSLQYDSRKVNEGSIFVAITGVKEEGHNFIADAIRKGAKAIVCRKEKISAELIKNNRVTWLFSNDTRETLALLAGQYYNQPAKKLKLIGVTGTNGKTTITYLLESIFSAAGFKTGLIGTINCRINKKVFPSKLTTPESLDLHNIFRQMVNEDIEYCFLEVSSHALALKRIWGLNFEDAIFTNLTPEHLDFHQTMEDYFDVKSKFFTEYAPKFSIINIDDLWGDKLVSRIKSNLNTYGLSQNAAVTGENISISADGSTFLLRTTEGSIPVKSNLIGRYNILNILAASSAALTCGISLKQIQDGIEQIKNVPGRFERVDQGQPFSVIVDYAHTEDALKNILLAARPLISGKLIILFGCGGDRDKKKRSAMGETAARYADYTIITTDNPRSESPEEIAGEIEEGFKKAINISGEKHRIILDRREAIAYAFSLAGEKDMVIIAGKGHEDYQIVKGQKLTFDDRKVAEDLLQI